jgi:DNA-binding MarR family transcriptional regulator
MSSHAESIRRSLPLIAQLGNTVVRELKEVMHASGLHPRQFAILGYLASTDQPTSQQTLSELIAVHRSAMVLLIDDLGEKEYVMRVRSDADRRTNDVVITDAGRAALRDVEPAAQEYEEDFLSALTPEEREEFRMFLVRIAQSRLIG